MHSIIFNGVIESVRTRQDKSLGLNISSSEMTGEECVAVIDLQGLACSITVAPLEGFTVTKEVKTELSKKTQSERIRAALYVWWSQLGEPGSYQAFYESETEKIIESIKKRLKPV